MKDSVSSVFAALADTTRRGLFEELLVSANGRTATELAEVASVSRQAIVKHLQVLERSGLAVARRDGREVRYFVVTDGTSSASKWLSDKSSQWDRRIAALEKSIESNPSTRRHSPKSQRS